MKTQLSLVLALSAAMCVSAQAGRHNGGNHNNNNGGGSRGSSGAVASGRALSAGGSSIRSGNFRYGGQAIRSGNFHYSGTRTINSARRLGAIHQNRIIRNGTPNQHTIRSQRINREHPGGIASNQNRRGNRGQNFQGVRGNHQTREGRATQMSQAIAKNQHIFARHAANQHPNWDKRHDHWWRGHRCHWHHNTWVIFDVGFFPFFYPWDYYYYGPYPYGPYPYSYDYGYGYGYDQGVPYDQGAPYEDQNVYEGKDYQGSQVSPDYQDDDGNNYYQDSSNQRTDSTVAAVQRQLAKHGHYRGQIDGVLGPETRHALVRYQSNNGLRVTGSLTPETMQSMNLQQQVARY